ncbi:tetratricopeptide repeat protein [Persicimonas caeni]|uniref:Tetratricopeptide repeat protein n=1 Tax=Persicimonas caeni TaxID=2292766 RepID=A0A4Y6PNY6_PERCE|nr:tetratricopeptide repeat protein [Persicimonas caeni]QDG50032.1 tetratricopeptide repeat protein [Persicimonas caeni]QED31253.1 tetratricopeptide repeat protein [Persicimonas caeni]
MLQSINHGWHELSQGNVDAAEPIFRSHLNDHPDSVEALRGLARVALHRGDTAHAETLAQRAHSIDSTADVKLLLGEILGAQGKRREAEQLLTQAVAFHTSDSYALALLGEQKIRQGRWDEGTQDFIEALSNDADGDGFRHLQKVLADLVDAYVAGRIPEQDAMKFVNRLDYSVPKTGPEMQSFFGEARRAINSGRSINRRQHAPEQTLPTSVRQAARGASTGAPSPAAPQSPPPQSQRPPEKRQTRAPQQRRPSAPRQQRPRSSNSSGTKQPGVDANQKDLQAIIQHERSLNQDLVAGLAEMGPPEWPSKAGYDSIDTVPPISLDRGSVLGESGGIDMRDFRITDGDLLSEIFLERCLRNLLVATQKNKATTIVLRPESIWQMEINCRDGLLDDLRPLSPLYKDRAGFENFRQLAFGMFIGECLAKTYDGAWTYETPASESYLEIGNMILEPFDLVARWMAAADKDDVDLDMLARQGHQASQQSTSMTIASDHIDPTRELSRDALPAKLAEMWALYRFNLSDTAFSHVASTIEVVESEDRFILFRIGAKWVPEFARGPQGAGIGYDDTVGMAYLRQSGQFLPLASRKGLARLLEICFDKLDKHSARRAIELLTDFHCPSWWVAANDPEAAKLSQKVGTQVNSPRFERQHSAKTLVISGVSSQGPVQWRLTHDPHQVVPWQLDLQR